MNAVHLDSDIPAQPADDASQATSRPELQSLFEHEQQQDQADQARTLEQMALFHARCDQAAEACWYLCRSLGLARQQEPGEPGLELLFQLLGALSDLPAEVCAAPLPEGPGDGLGIAELCHQLEAARALTQDAWDEAPAAHAPPTAPALALH